MGLICKLFGHKLVLVGDPMLGVAGPQDCTRCGRHWTGINWSHFGELDEALAAIDIAIRAEGEKSSQCARNKSAMPEHQVLKVKAGDTVVIAVDRVLMPEHRTLMTQAMKDKFPEDVKAMVLDKGMTIKVVSPHREARVPWPDPYAGYQPRQTSAATAPPPKKP